MSGTQKAIPGLLRVIAFAAGGISALLGGVVIVSWHLRFTVPPQSILSFPAIRTALVLEGLLLTLAIALMTQLAGIVYQQVVNLFDSYNIINGLNSELHSSEAKRVCDEQNINSN